MKIIKKNLILDHSDAFRYNKKFEKFYINHFCISDKKNFDLFNKKNTLSSHWGNRKKIIKKYFFLKKITNDVFTYLVKKLNFVHKIDKNKNYWRIIIFPWVFYYVCIIYDRWKTIELLKKRKNFFFVKFYKASDNFLEIKNTEDWINKSTNDLFNNNLLIKIIKYQKFSNIRIHKVRYKKLNNIKKKKFKFFELIDKLLSRISLKYNTLFFDKLLINKSIFARICIKFFQVPSLNLSLFSDFYDSKIKYDYKKRKNIKYTYQAKSKFEKFLIEEIFNFLPISFFENFLFFKRKNKNFFKKKRIFLGMFSSHLDDYFKIFLAESILKGSRHIHFFHGAGFHRNDIYDDLFNHFEKISNKLIVSTPFNKKKNNIFIGYDIFKKSSLNKNKKKLLINFHENRTYEIRVPIATNILSKEIEIFQSLTKSIKKLKMDILKNVKFRPKQNLGLNTLERFKKIFGEGSVEDASSVTYRESLKNSKLVVCYYPQTSFIEAIYNNVPTILVGSSHGLFYEQKSKNILKILKKNRLFFERSEEAIRFINNNWENLHIWWNQKKTQNVRKLLLLNYYQVSKNYDIKLFNFIKEELEYIK